MSPLPALTSPPFLFSATVTYKCCRYPASRLVRLEKRPSATGGDLRDKARIFCDGINVGTVIKEQPSLESNR